MPGEAFLGWWSETKARAVDVPAVTLRPIDDIDNYKRLRRLETAARLGGAPAEVSVWIDGRIPLLGIRNIEAGFAGLMNARRNMKPGALPAQKPAAPALPKPASAATEPCPPRDGGDGASALRMRLYHFSNCRRCEAVIGEAKRVAAERAGRVELRIIDCEKDRAEIPRLLALLKRYPDAPRVSPSIVALVGDAVLLGADGVVENLRAVVARQLERGGSALVVRRLDGPAGDGDLAAGLGLVPVVLAALADGVNPCAFAAIVLLISILTTARPSDSASESTARGLLLGGGAFIAGVFVTYYAAGMAALTVIGGLGAFPTARAILFWVVWALAVAGAVFSAVDAWTYYRTGDPKRLKLKVPAALRSLFVPVLRGRFRRLGLIAGGFASGVIIAVLEGVCTGQMYLPTIQYMASTPGLRLRGAAYLFLYNALFVLPLVAILAAAVAGAHFHRLSSFLRRHIGETKIAMAVVFVVLAAGLLLSR
jgi:cytochrome c biogenesis protein CcdA